jgi:hypothetical protein
MFIPRAPSWMYVVAALYVLAFFFNTRQEFLGPAPAGWTLELPSLNVLNISSSSPVQQAGARVDDVLESVNGQPLRTMPDWFLARAHFERNLPVMVQIRRGDQHLCLHFIISAPAWSTWNTSHSLAVMVFYFARFALLLLAIAIAFTHPQQRSARLLALMFAIGAVAEGYPSSGWAASLHHLSMLFAIPIYLAVASCLLSPLVLLFFVGSFPRPRHWPKWQLAVVLLPAAILAISILQSGIVMIYTPTLLARHWSVVLSATPLRAIQTTAGVTPLLFLSMFPLNQVLTQSALLELWIVFSILCFASTLLVLCATYLQLDDTRERRQVRAISLCLLLFSVIVAHNLLARNWTLWFGTALPAMFSAPSFLIEDILFLVVPLTLAYSVVKPGSLFPADGQG